MGSIGCNNALTSLYVTIKISGKRKLKAERYAVRLSKAISDDEYIFQPAVSGKNIFNLLSVLLNARL